MRFEDPAPVDCEYCHYRSLLPVRQLLRLQATCPNCHQSLEPTGLQMRAQLDDWHGYLLLIELVLEVEQETGTQISDEELDGIHTLRQLARTLESKLPNSMDRTTQAIEIVQRAALSTSQRDVIDVDANFLDAMKPNRWA